MPFKSLCRALRYAGAFIILASIPLLYVLNPFAPLATIALILLVILFGEQLSPDWAENDNAGIARAARLLPILYIPAQMAIVVWGVIAAGRAGASVGQIVALAAPAGLTMGIFGVLAAHEMVHSQNAYEQHWGGLLLTGMCYRHFRVAHVYGHHRLAGTEDDPSTARRGESFYAFLVRTVRGQIVFAWSFECRRCHKKQLSWVHNRCLHDLAVTALLCAIVFLTLGKGALLFFILQSTVAILVLELFNYIAHYGLARRRDAAGLIEPFGPRHAWNMSAAFANLVIFNMGRHSDHHRRAAAPYETLRPVAQSPELPAGYAGSILMALIPPLWRHVMDRKLTLLSTSRAASQTA